MLIVADALHFYMFVPAPDSFAQVGRLVRPLPLS
jgi:hypothetical protein